DRVSPARTGGRGATRPPPPAGGTVPPASRPDLPVPSRVGRIPHFRGGAGSRLVSGRGVRSVSTAGQHPPQLCAGLGSLSATWGATAGEGGREVAWCRAAEFDGYQLPGSIRRSYARALAA